jgi:hypothetical protein
MKKMIACEVCGELTDNERFCSRQCVWDRKKAREKEVVKIPRKKKLVKKVIDRWAFPKKRIK